MSTDTPHWIGEHDGVVEFNPSNDATGPRRCRINVGCDQVVEVEKLYGPLIFATIRVRADHATCEWIIERESIKDGSWSEVARVPGQIDDEFSDEVKP